MRRLSRPVDPIVSDEPVETATPAPPLFLKMTGQGLVPRDMNPFVLALLIAALYNVFVPASKNATPVTVLVPFEHTPPANVTETLYTFPLLRGANEPEKIHPPALDPVIEPGEDNVTVTDSVPPAVAAEPV